MKSSSLLVLLAVLGLAQVAAGVPVIDGRFDPSEGYASGSYIDFDVEGGGWATGGELWLHQDPATADLSIVFIQPVTLVDNTYGANSIGWGALAPSGKNHNFTDLLGSDKAQFQVTDGLGNLLLDVTVDYITAKDGGYRSLGVTGGDGVVTVGAASDVKAYGTSLDYNFNTLGHDSFIVNSPLSVPDYSDPASAPGWVFEVIYELKVDGALFAANGLGDVTIPLVHDSPNKIAKNKVFPKTDIPIPPDQPLIPEPATGSLLLLGLLAAPRRRK